jgi:hypothetical protein
MSQGSQGSFSSGRTVLPLSKFSHATVHGESIAPIPWFHIGKSDNLLAVFEFLRVEESRGQVKDVKKFKVLYDPEVLVRYRGWWTDAPKLSPHGYLPMSRKKSTLMSWQAKRIVQDRKLKIHR